MTIHTRTIAAVAAACGVLTGLVFGQAAGTPAPQGQQPGAQAPPPQGRGGEGGRQGEACRRLYAVHAPAGSAGHDCQGQGAVTRPTAPAVTRPIFAGTADGKHPNLLRSGVALRDQKGELIGARVAKHAQPITLIEADTVAVAEYIHSVHATMGSQGSPPGAIPPT